VRTVGLSDDRVPSTSHNPCTRNPGLAVAISEANSAHPRMEPPKSGPDRFRRIPTIGAAKGLLWFHRRARIARARRFRAILRDARKTRDWMVEQSGFEPSTPTSHSLAKLPADLAMNLTKIKSALLERGSSPRIRLITGKTIHLDGPRIIATDSLTLSVGQPSFRRPSISPIAIFGAKVESPYS